MSREWPQVGSWYKNVEEDRSFEVVAFDEDEELIEIQYEGGELEELDLDTWNESPITAIDAPEDWEGPYDDTEMDDRESRPRRRFAMDEEDEEWDEDEDESLDDAMEFEDDADD